jgi:hypothetical protein
MTALGKSLVFYFKYWTEMQRICATEGGELEGLPEPEKTREMAQEIGAKAHRQAADLLEACTPGLEAHFKSVGKCMRITARKVVERKWSLSYSIYPKIKPAKARMMAGISIVRLDQPEIIPWIWRLGGDEADQKLELILASQVKVRSLDLDWGTGVVGLDRIPIFADEPKEFDVDRDLLVERVRQAFLAFSPQHLAALWPK